MFELYPLLFVGRMENGDIRLVRLKTPPAVWPQADRPLPDDEVNIDIHVPREAWARAVQHIAGEAIPRDTATGLQSGSGSALARSYGRSDAF